MRKINLSNARTRNAEVGFELPSVRTSVSMRRSDGADYRSVRMLKSSISTGLNQLVLKFGSDLTEQIINDDPEIDMEIVGKYLRRVKKIFIDPNGKAAYRVSRQTVFYTPQGEEKNVQKYHTVEANVNTDVSLKWTGKLIDKAKASRMFVFGRKYQIRHVNGLTFDFLYDMAKQLHDSNSLMLVGAGAKGNSPLVMTSGGVPYRAFLEGRIDGDKYCLLLHLTNLELKSL